MGQRQPRNQRHADPGRHEPLNGLVVVALEGHVRLESSSHARADDVARAGAGRGRLHPVLVAEIGSASTPRLAASGCSAGSATCMGSSSSGIERSPAPARSRTPGNSNNSARSNSPRRNRGAISSGSPSASVSGHRGGYGESWPRRPASASRPADGNEATRSRPARTPSTAAASVSAASTWARIASACSTRVAPAAVGSHTSAVAHHQPGSGFGLEPGPPMGDGRLGVGAAPRRRPRTTRGR